MQFFKLQSRLYNFNMGYIRQCPYKIWRLITLEPITYLIVSIHHTVCLIDLNKNNYAAWFTNNRFKSYGPPNFIRTLSDIPHTYVICIIICSWIFCFVIFSILVNALYWKRLARLNFSDILYILPNFHQLIIWILK